MECHFAELIIEISSLILCFWDFCFMDDIVLYIHSYLYLRFFVNWYTLCQGNSISTTKYNFFTFLPKGLFEQVSYFNFFDYKLGSPLYELLHCAEALFITCFSKYIGWLLQMACLLSYGVTYMITFQFSQFLWICF